MQNQIDQLSPIVLDILKRRGFDYKDIAGLISWDLHSVPNLTQMHDLEKACDRLLKAVKLNEKIGIYGDYDVDGTTSCAIFFHFFRMIGVNVSLYQPSRFKDGYGLHHSSIEKALDDNVDLLVTVDCGISNVDQAQYAKDKGLDLIITDHHKDAAEVIPPAYAVVNPNRRDEPQESPLKVLAGVGVAFCLCVRMREKILANGGECPSLYPLLQFYAIGTISDLAKLTPVNLTLTRHGLKQMIDSQFMGIRTFFTPEERQQSMALSDKISFGIGPMINSKGRLDHPELALELLTTDSSEMSYHYHSQLVDCNNERKSIQNKVFEQAKEQLEDSINDDENHVVSIVYSEDWHEGVIGIVASKLVESYKAAAIVFTDTDEKGIIKASARTAGELNLFDCLHQCKELFLKFGGHKAAAGLSMKKENLPLLRKKLTQIISEIPYSLRASQDTYDMELDIDQIDFELVKSLEVLEPFGMGNKKPVFKLVGAQLESYRLMKDVHVRWNLKSQKSNKKIQGVSFYYVNAFETVHPDIIIKTQVERNPQYLCTVGINRFRGNESIQLMINKVILN